MRVFVVQAKRRRWGQYGSKVFFTANDGTAGTELWLSDGTAAGTFLLKDIARNKPTTASGYAHCITDVNGTVYYVSNDGKSGHELWKSDGTAAGTGLVKDVWPGPNSGTHLISSNELISKKAVGQGNKLFFAGNDGNAGLEIWVTDGTAAGTKMVRDIWPGPKSGGFGYGCVLGGHVYFFARNSSGDAIWRTDGTSAGTTTVSNKTRAFNYQIVMGGKIFFGGRGISPNTGGEPWITDGTNAGTMMLKDICPGAGGGGFDSPCILGGHVYFRADDGSGYAIWRTDGTTAGTTKVSAATTAFWNPIAFKGKIYFMGEDMQAGLEIWVTDGTAAGTKLASDTYPGRDWGLPYPNASSRICISGGHVYFEGYNHTTGGELYMLGDAAISAGIPGPTAQSVGRSYGPGKFMADDPVLNTTMNLTVSGMPANTAGLILFGFEDPNPYCLVPGMEFYFSIRTRGALMTVPLPSTGNATLPVPNINALLGARLIGQTIIGPTTTTPLGVAVTNGVLFTFGR